VRRKRPTAPPNRTRLPGSGVGRGARVGIAVPVKAVANANVDWAPFELGVVKNLGGDPAEIDSG